jgi:murein DD-endopeptidase MepM/ murein hydrolase activator NlpD
MTGKKWTFLVLADENAPIRQFSISRRRLRVAVGGAVALSVTLVLLAGIIGLGSSARHRAGELEQENAELANQLNVMQERVSGLEGFLADITRRNGQFRTLAGLSELDDEVLEVGIGGPGTGTPETNSLWTLNPDLGEAAFAVEYDLNALERRARLLSSSLAEATDSLVAHRDLLESTPSILPTSGWLSSPFSQSRFHPIHHQALPHEGIDISAPEGTPIQATAKGRVTAAGWTAGLGYMVEIDHGYGYVTRYGHASKLLVQRGQRVNRGDVIAQVGSTGIANGPHLHYEVHLHGKPQNPMNYVIRGVIP